MGDATGFNLALPTGEFAYDLKFIVCAAYKCLVVEFLEGALPGKGKTEGQDQNEKFVSVHYFKTKMSCSNFKMKSEN